MRETALKERLKQICPTAYLSFDGPEELPYVTYIFEDSKIIPADDSICTKVIQWQIELYTRRRDRGLEGKIRTVLDGFGVIFTVSLAWIPDESCYVTYFRFEDWEEQDAGM